MTLTDANFAATDPKLVTTNVVCILKYVPDTHVLLNFNWKIKINWSTKILIKQLFTSRQLGRLKCVICFNFQVIAENLLNIFRWQSALFEVENWQEIFDKFHSTAETPGCGTNDPGQTYKLVQF